MEHKAEGTKPPVTTATESKGVLGSVWSAAGAIAETVQHAVQGMTFLRRTSPCRFKKKYRKKSFLKI
jgi:hypothetical protein